MHLSDLARWRQLVYRLLSSALLYPNGERLNTLAAAAGQCQGLSQNLAEFGFFPQWQQLLPTLTELPSRQGLEGQFVRLFVNASEGAPCLPYESVYLDPGRQATGWIIAQVEREYAAAGLGPSPSLKDLPDHVAVELEFMGFLCSQEAQAWEQKAVLQGLKALERQGGFLDCHLLLWLPAWARDVAAADDQGLYSVVAETARAFVTHDRGLLRILLERCQRMSAAQPAPRGSRKSKAAAPSPQL